MRAVLLLIVAVAFAEVKCHPQGTNAEEVGMPTPVGGETPSLPTFSKGLAGLKKIREEIPELLKTAAQHESKSPPGGNAPVLGLGIGTLYNTLLGGVHNLYQDLLNRQQAFINLLTCGNCVNEGWDAIMDVAQTIPELEWVYKPSTDSATTFFTAIHQNGTVTGIGGSVVNGKPVAEYAFGNDGIKQHLTDKNKDKVSS
ncbi:hypothetical protein RUM43_014323 [Polyplax serrata]|uniref:Uncharacterized protein n=1 Tax=Polyplax serrata TaxID=468196 RepID=A0AAN8NZZ1_POLSC